MANNIRVKIHPSKDFDEIKAKVLSIRKEEAQKDEEVEGKEVEEFFDFEKIIPMPDTIYRGNVGKAEEEKYGKENCWYDWSIRHWGTKWNSYSFDKWALFDEEFSFETAWSQPFPVIVALSKMFPTVAFEVKYADEDLGNNLGEYTIENGEITEQTAFEDDDERELFARRLRD